MTLANDWLFFVIIANDPDEFQVVQQVVLVREVTITMVRERQDAVSAL